jgi:tripartite-type tricarboxylate transporter receptor subunit TctC
MRAARFTALACFVCLGLVTSGLPSHGQYTDRARRITLTVPFAAGVRTISWRARSAKLGDASKIPVIIENYVGASGSLGAARAAQAAPDGYTSSTYTINSAIMSKLPFDAKTSLPRSPCSAGDDDARDVEESARSATSRS